MRDIKIALADDAGGADKLTEPERLLINQAARLQVTSEGEVDVGSRAPIASTISVIMAQLHDIRGRSINTALATAAD